MYTLRTFKKRDEINRLQINLGNSYQVKQDAEKGIKYRVYCDNPLAPEGGYAIFEDDYAFFIPKQIPHIPFPKQEKPINFLKQLYKYIFLTIFV